MTFMQLILVVCVAFLIHDVSGQQYDDVNFHKNWQNIPLEECGIGTFSDRIIGGKKAHLGQFPWMVRIGYKIPNGTYQFDCDGVLVNRIYVLTAAHCQSQPDHVIRRVHLGENSLLTEKDCEGGICAPLLQDIPVIKEYLHENFSRNSLLNDIALLRLAFRAKYNEFVQPICFPHNSTLMANYKNAGAAGFAKVAGWGQTDPNVDVYTYPHLMYITKPIKPLEFCKSFYIAKPLWEGQICAGEGHGVDSCIGDSGGPLMRPMMHRGSKTPKYTIIGIVSYGKSVCGTAPAIYTKISFYMKWILDRVVRK